MRRIAMFNLVTADGYCAAKDGNLDLFVPRRNIVTEARVFPTPRPLTVAREV